MKKINRSEYCAVSIPEEGPVPEDYKNCPPIKKGEVHRTDNFFPYCHHAGMKGATTCIKCYQYDMVMANEIKLSNRWQFKSTIDVATEYTLSTESKVEVALHKYENNGVFIVCWRLGLYTPIDIVDTDSPESIDVKVNEAINKSIAEMKVELSILKAECI